jgi:hypothetical protein
MTSVKCTMFYIRYALRPQTRFSHLRQCAVCEVRAESSVGHRAHNTTEGPHQGSSGVRMADVYTAQSVTIFGHTMGK